MNKMKSDRKEGRAFCHLPAPPLCYWYYLQQLDLQQSAHLPSVHFLQELQEVLQQLLQTSEAEAVARLYPATIASSIPALMRIQSDFMFFIFLGWERMELSAPPSALPKEAKSPKDSFEKDQKSFLEPPIHPQSPPQPFLFRFIHQLRTKNPAAPATKVSATIVCSVGLIACNLHP